MDTLDLQADVLAQKVRHLIITSSGRTVDQASTEEFFIAFCSCLREEIMVNWSATMNTMESSGARMAYFLSLEYLPGRLTRNNITNIGATELVQRILKKLRRGVHDLLSCEPDAGLGNGGLGRLASCFLDSLATLSYPAWAYGLRYQYGIFEQEIWDGRQVEKPDCWLLNANPWELRRDSHALHVHYRGTIVPGCNRHGDEIALLDHYEDVRAIPYDVPVIGYNAMENYSVLSLRLWSAKESPRNFQLQSYNAGQLDLAAENTSLTDVLYPNDNTEFGKRMRLKQEYLLVAASLQDIFRYHRHNYGEMKNFADKTRIQINDTHPALGVAELIRCLTTDYDYSWKEARDACLEICSYTNHTILREALEEWDEGRLKDLLPRQHAVIQKLNWDFCNEVRTRFPNDEEKVRAMSILEHGRVRMANLSIVGSHKVNGVAALHTDILKAKIFPEFHQMYPDRLVNVTNGVTQRRWLLDANPALSAFITERIGKEWITDFRTVSKLAKFGGDQRSQEELLKVKKQNKEALLYFIQHESVLHSSEGKTVAVPSCLGSDALFDVHIKRFHEYKRQLLNALHVIMVYQEILDAPQSSRRIPRFSLFGGKAAPAYVRAKEVIQLIAAIARKLHKSDAVHDRLCVAFIENYNVSKAEIIIPAADLSEQISTAGWEASGTGNMKLSINGALTIGTDDGANVEMRQSVGDRWWPFLFGQSAEQNEGPNHPWDIYRQDTAIRRAVDALKDGTFARNAAEEAAFSDIHRHLIEHDTYRVLQDLRSYYEAQKKVEALYQTPAKWAETVLHNIAGMGPFSADNSIRNYAEKIWNIQPYPCDKNVLAKVREEYSLHDRCRIV
ncbi:MAG: glycogen phosphorylase [Chlamydiota bacterium]|jgi:starch phosphorylase